MRAGYADFSTATRSDASLRTAPSDLPDTPVFLLGIATDAYLWCESLHCGGQMRKQECSRGAHRVPKHDHAFVLGTDFGYLPFPEGKSLIPRYKTATLI